MDAYNHDSRRARIEDCIHHLDHVLPAQASIRDFVHHNTLHGFQHLPFPEAIAASARLTGGSAWLPEDTCRAFYQSGRIDGSDLDAALARIAAEAGIDLDRVLAACDGRTVTRREVVRLGLLHDLAPLSPAQFRWQVEELGVLEAAAGLWSACLDVLGIDPGFDHPEALLELSMREERQAQASTGTQEAFDDAVAALWDELKGRVGADCTLTQLVKVLTSEDALETVRPMLIRQLAAHLDQGLAPWANPLRSQGFYAAWKSSASQDLFWPLENLDTVREQLKSLPDDPWTAVMDELVRLGLPEERWASYLERLALELPGWSGMFLWRQHHTGYAQTQQVPVAMIDCLAVRLLLDRFILGAIVQRHWGIDASLPALGRHFRGHPAELWVRQAFHEGDLPEYLLDLIEPHLIATADETLPQESDLWDWLAGRIDAWRSTPTAELTTRHGLTRSAWPLYSLAQRLKLSEAGLRALGRSGAEALLGALRQLDRHQRGHLWLLAYERHYREQILAALAANHGRWQGHEVLTGCGPRAQLVFCMDDREEGMRRHLEEIAPDLETLGGAAHFAVFQNYTGLDDSTATPLCPVVPEVIVPSHNVHEVPRDEKVDAGETAVRHRVRQSRRLKWREALNQTTRHGLALAPVLAACAAPGALAGMVWRAVMPGSFGRATLRWKEAFDLPVPTRLGHAAALAADGTAAPATPQAPRDGFTDAEGAERIGNYLTALGLTRHFAALVVIMGHGSNSVNNPHLAAYDCGACAGRHSGPNARLFAALANRPGVRTLLATRGIVVPEGTWFIGAEHNTADDLITWYDVEDIPVSLASTFRQLDADLDAAARAHAQERCRRLFSAPLDIGPDAALAHVWGRRNDWSQARPELGHATNACAFIGRRALSRGAFFDRRSFLISYDPTQDPEGKVLERHLLVNGAVGAGISLEYFFSTANNAHFGCGSKVTHNVSGYLGVMQGAASDLVTGLPRQMIEVHEAMRLLVVVEQTLEIITAIYQRQPPLQELVGNGWVIVAAKDPDSGAIHLFDPSSGWQPWTGKAEVPTVKQSTDWFRGRREPLPPVLLERPLEATV